MNRLNDDVSRLSSENRAVVDAIDGLKNANPAFPCAPRPVY